MPTYLKVSTNNRADTVLQYFKEAEELYGLPSRIRCDQGFIIYYWFEENYMYIAISVQEKSYLTTLFLISK